METRILISGFGGQGVMVIGKLLGYAASAIGKKVLFLPTYGPEQRGGTSNCTITISDDEIGSPISNNIDILIALNEPALKKFLIKVKPEGTVIINSSRCKVKACRDDVATYYIPSDDIAFELGSNKVANIIILGSLIGKLKVLTEDDMMNIIKVKLGKKPELLNLNKVAFKKGMEQIKIQDIKGTAYDE